MGKLSLEEKFECLPAKEVEKLATVCWTSECTVLDRELCSFINQALFKDESPLIEAVVPVCRLLNRLIVTRGKMTTPIPWPADYRTYRGLGMPEEYFDFFEVGKIYRAPMYVATSSDQKVAKRFMARNSGGKKL